MQPQAVRFLGKFSFFKHEFPRALVKCCDAYMVLIIIYIRWLYYGLQKRFVAFKRTRCHSCLLLLGLIPTTIEEGIVTTMLSSACCLCYVFVVLMISPLLLANLLPKHNTNPGNDTQRKHFPPDHL